MKDFQRSRFFLLLQLVCFVAFLSTIALAEDANFVPLSNTDLLSIVRSDSSSEWQYFQPSSRETYVDCSSKAFLQNVVVYPILARHGSQYKLILLKKENGHWMYASENTAALVRREFELVSFSVDENVNADDQHLYVFFEFSTSQYQKFTLELVLNSSFSYFCSIGMTPTGESLIQKTTTFEPYRGFTFITDYYTDYATCLFSTSYYLEDLEERSFSFEEFTFDNIPIIIEDLLYEEICTEELHLYALPTSNSELPFSVSPGETIFISKQNIQHEWSIVKYDGNMFFCICNEIK